MDSDRDVRRIAMESLRLQTLDVKPRTTFAELDVTTIERALTEAFEAGYRQGESDERYRANKGFAY